MRNSIIKAMYTLSLIGFLALPLIIMAETARRGYLAIGGEWMIPVIPLLMVVGLKHPVDGDADNGNIR